MHTHTGPLQHTPRRRGVLRALATTGVLSLALVLAAPASAQAGTTTVAEAAAAKQAYKQYALDRLGGDTAQHRCLDRLWEKESGWNPRAQNPTSTAYGIPQFLDSTWAGTGIRKTSDPYRQVDAGLIYIGKRYGSSCGAWQHHQRRNWY